MASIFLMFVLHIFDLSFPIFMSFCIHHGFVVLFPLPLILNASWWVRTGRTCAFPGPFFDVPMQRTCAFFLGCGISPDLVRFFFFF